MMTNQFFMKPLITDNRNKLCKRCCKNPAVDSICPACKNELIAIYENKLTWRMAYEIERISKRALRYTRNEAEEELY
jgi:hypothetical protein